MSKVVTEFITYRTKRAELKRKYRDELERELAPYLKQFGEAVVAEQGSGKTIDDIEDLIGVRNRNLIYAAKRAAKGFAPQPGPTTPAPAPEAAGDPSVPRVQVVAVSNDGWEVYIDGSFKGTIWADQESLEIPEDWALDTERSALYREAIGMVRDAIKG